MEAKTTKGAGAWLELATSSQLPILKASAQLLTKQIKTGASLADMAHTIERDPALCLHLFLAANRKKTNSDVEILSLNHVMTMLGMQGVIHSIKQAPKMALNKSDAMQKAYLQAQANSTLAGRLVEHWAAQTHSGSAEKLKWATILAGAPVWYMWHVGYSVMNKWQFTVHHVMQPAAKVENKLFGCLLEDVYRMLGRRIHLPNLSQQLLERAEWPTLRQWGKLLSDKHMLFSDDDHVLRHLKSKPSTVMLLLNYLAGQVQRGWHTPKCIRSQRALAHLSGLDIQNVIHQNHRLAVNMSRQLIAEQVLPPAVSLLWPMRKMNEPAWARKPYYCWIKDPNPQVQDQQSSIQAVNRGERLTALKDVPPRIMKKEVLVGVLKQLNKSITEFNGVQNIFLACNHALENGLGMGRGFVSIMNKSGECLRPVYCFGVERDDPIRNLSIALKDNRLFAKLIQKSASFRIDADNVEQALNMLHPSVVKSLKCKNCMVMSIFSHNKPVGVVYVDVTPEEQPISDQEYQAFKKICQGTSYALEQYAKR